MTTPASGMFHVKHGGAYRAPSRPVERGRVFAGGSRGGERCHAESPGALLGAGRSDAATSLATLVDCRTRWAPATEPGYWDQMQMFHVKRNEDLGKPRRPSYSRLGGELAIPWWSSVIGTVPFNALGSWPTSECAGLLGGNACHPADRHDKMHLNPPQASCRPWAIRKGATGFALGARLIRDGKSSAGRGHPVSNALSLPRGKRRRSEKSVVDQS